MTPGLALTILAIAVLTAMVVRRQRALAAGERQWRTTHPVGAAGVVPGAESIVLDAEGDRGVLLLHGFGDTPQSIARLARALHASGWSVAAPLLPGHGRTLEAFQRTTAADWTDAARASYAALTARYRSVAIVGLSMGGALATRLAADGAPPAALVLLVPYLHVARKARVLTSAWRAWSLWRAWVPGRPEASILDPVARRESLGYGCATPRLLRELRRVVDAAAAAAPSLAVPTLAVFSTHDYRIAPDVARAAFARLGASEKVVHWVERSGHVITVDHDAERVERLVVDWLQRH